MFDRDTVVTAVDLADLADELLGQRAGPARSPSWRCPKPTHRQTGRTPPLTVFTSRGGEQRWHCHGCGAGGTAIDLVMETRGVDAGEAIRVLADRERIAELKPHGPSATSPPRRRGPAGGSSRPAPPATVRAVPALDRYVRECADMLWARAGPARRAVAWLTQARGLPEPLLRANRVGFDLGPLVQARPDGLPRITNAVVLPILVADGPAYVQLRQINPGRNQPRYLNPASRLAENPRVGRIRPAGSAVHDEVIVTEGIIDALSAATAGYRAVAVLGAGTSSAAAAGALALIPHPLVVAFDPDDAGRSGAARLARLLAERHRTSSNLVLDRGDLNESLVTSHDWRTELPALVDQARAVTTPDAARGL